MTFDEERSNFVYLAKSGTSQMKLKKFTVITNVALKSFGPVKIALMGFIPN